MNWNFDLTVAPRGKIVTSTRTVKDKVHEISEFVPDFVWLATKCGKVIRTNWLPATKFSPARWVGLGVAEQPVAWQPFVMPEHPFAAASQGDAAATAPTNVSLPEVDMGWSGDGANAGGGHVTDGENTQTNNAGEHVNSSPAALITHKHIFLDDVGSGA